MSFINDYQPEEYKVAFNCSDGKHEMVIKGARTTKTSTGKQMLEVGFGVKEGAVLISTTYVERMVEGDYFNQNMTKFFDAFKIQRGNFDFKTWVGKMGAGEFVHTTSEWTDQYGQPKTTVKCECKYFYTENTPEASAPVQSKPQTKAAENNTASDFPEDIPF